MVQELTAGFAQGWAFHYWRIVWKERSIGQRQMEGLERCAVMRLECLRLLIVAWTMVARLLASKHFVQDLKLKRLDKRILNVRKNELDDTMGTIDEHAMLERTVQFLTEKTHKHTQMAVTSISYRLDLTPPEKLRKIVHKQMGLFTELLISVSKHESERIKEKMLRKDILFLSVSSSETADILASKPGDELLLRWVNYFLAEAKHRATQITTGSIEFQEDSMKNWGGSDHSKYMSRCREVRSVRLAKSLEEVAKDGLKLTTIFAMFHAFRNKGNTLDPAYLTPLDERNNDTRIDAAHNLLMTLAPNSATRCLLSLADIQKSHLHALQIFLSAVFLYETPGLEGAMRNDAFAETHEKHKSSRVNKKKTMIEPVAEHSPSRGSTTQEQEEEKEQEKEDTEDHPMSKLIRSLEGKCGRVAYPELPDLTRLLYSGETLLSLDELDLPNILLRWANVQISGCLLHKDDYKVKNLHKSLASGEVLLEIMKLVAPQAIATETPQMDEGLSAVKQVMQFAARCIPFCFIADDAFVGCQEDHLSSVVASLLYRFPNLRPELGSDFCHQLEVIDRVLKAGIKVMGMDEETVACDNDGLSLAFCDECHRQTDGPVDRLKEALDAAWDMHQAVERLNRRLQAFSFEIGARRVFARLKFKGMGDKSRSQFQDQTLRLLQNLTHDEGWKQFMATEHASFSSYRVRSTLRNHLRLYSDLAELYGVRIGDSEIQEIRIHWSGVARMYRDCNLFCPCLFLPLWEAERIYYEVMGTEKKLEELAANRPISPESCSKGNVQIADTHANEQLWHPSGIGLSGFLRFILRLSLNREVSARQGGATEVTLARSVAEVAGRHLGSFKGRSDTEEEEEEEDFIHIMHNNDILRLQENWEPFLRAIFKVFADFGLHDSDEDFFKCGHRAMPEFLGIGADGFISLLRVAGLFNQKGSALTDAAARQAFEHLLERGRFRPHKKLFCYQGEAEARRSRRVSRLKRTRSMPTGVRAPEPHLASLCAPPGKQVVLQDALVFEDFQDAMVCMAMYHCPSPVMPLRDRYEGFLSGLIEGLSQVSLPQPGFVGKPELPEGILPRPWQRGLYEAKTKSWEKLRAALSEAANGTLTVWSNQAQQEWVGTIVGATLSSGKPSKQTLASLSELAKRDSVTSEPQARAKSAPPKLSLPTWFQKAQKTTNAARGMLSVISALRPREGSVEGLGLGAGSKLATAALVMKAARQFGTFLTASQLSTKRKEGLRLGLQRKKKDALNKVRALRAVKNTGELLQQAAMP
eukprot:TRINITY_DN27798_c0_g1_i1.p1 TRINITY_DN27798_c0_g1~~TRINITY_DN27798_c0_g1_i1.p1  ORF type:complete len:1456 (-),score=291.20 TRINITY_DN27798_c0_g1_i1:48-3842(-)